jgi:hypothetical protein
MAVVVTAAAGCGNVGVNMKEFAGGAAAHFPPSGGVLT